MSGFIGSTCAGLDEFIEAGHGASTLGELPYNGSSMQAVITYEAVVAHAAAEAAAEAARVAQVAGIAVAQVLDEASKLAPGLALMQNGPGGGGPSPVNGSSGNMPNSAGDPLQAKYKVQIEGIAEIDSKISSLSKNNQNHILADHHEWYRLVKDPKDWDAISRIMTKVMKEGSESLYPGAKQIPGITILQRELSIGNEVVTVIFRRYLNGDINVGNAWVNK